MTQAAKRRLPAAPRPLTPGELKLLRIAARQAARKLRSLAVAAGAIEIAARKSRLRMLAKRAALLEALRTL